MDMSALGGSLKTLYQSLGLLSRVTLLRIDTTQSDAPHDMYRERQEVSKVYTRFEVDALVDEMVLKPFMQRNLITAVGTRDNFDAVVYIFGESPVEPTIDMKVEYRGQRLDIITVNTFHSQTTATGESQMGWALNCKRLT